MKINDAVAVQAQLERWRRRFSDANYPEFHSVVKQFWRSIGSTPLLAAISERFRTRPAPPSGSWEQIVGHLHVSPMEVEHRFCEDEEDHYSFCYHVIKTSAEEAFIFDRPLQTELQFVRTFHPGESDPAWQYRFFRNNFVFPLLDAFEAALDTNKAALAILRRYKHKCEWFNRQTLSDSWNTNPSKGEWILKLHLYEYLHDNGLQFQIDPYSPTGKVDLLATQAGGDEKLVADAKLVKAKKVKTPVRDGFHQVYKYTGDYHEPFGYLVVFNASVKDLRINGDGSQMGIPYVAHNNKTIYIMTIDINPDPESASKSGGLKTVPVDKAYLISEQSGSEDTEDEAQTTPQ
jgi:hypothetical protein